MPDHRIGWSWSPAWAVVVATVVSVEAVVNVYVNATAGAWMGAILGGAIPSAAAFTWWTQRQQGTEQREVADAMMVYVMLAMSLYLLAVWP